MLVVVVVARNLIWGGNHKAQGNVIVHKLLVSQISFSDPSNHFILGNLSHVYSVLEEYEKALDYADRACKKTPNWAKVCVDKWLECTCSYFIRKFA
jgi:hypothetical protein